MRRHHADAAALGVRVARDGLPWRHDPAACIGDCQHAWLAHVRAEVAASGAPVEGICWYPWLDQPVWGRPRGRARWPCGYPQPSAGPDRAEPSHAAA